MFNFIKNRNKRKYKQIISFFEFKYNFYNDKYNYCSYNDMNCQYYEGMKTAYNDILIYLKNNLK